MKRIRLTFTRSLLCVLALSFTVGCQQGVTSPRRGGEAPRSAETPELRLHVVNRITWGANPSTMKEVEAVGLDRYIEQQLSAPTRTTLRAPVQAQIDAMTISQQPLEALAVELERQRRAFRAMQDPEAGKLAQRAFQQELTRLAREAAARAILRALYSPHQLHEKMTWFWMNHFNVFQGKATVRAMIGDYEENAIRPHALGRFRTLLGAVSRHPAMLRYLDNAQNAANRINENYARELMELHTLGVDGGYSQRDVQELARVLTGVGIAYSPHPRKVRADRQAHYVRRGLFEFNPNRHDYGHKVVLGRPIRSAGLAEVDEALDRLARHPSTARFIARKLALYFVSDDPPPALIDRVAQTFRSTDGDIAATLRVLFAAPEFSASLGRKFKDPVHYVFSAVRLAYDDRPILNPAPMIFWLNRLGQGLYRRETPDGYPLTSVEWQSPGQMTTRFEVARTIGSGAAGLFRREVPDGVVQKPAFPQLSNALYHQAIQKTLGPATLKALEQATSPQEWNAFLLSSPEFMRR